MRDADTRITDDPVLRAFVDACRRPTAEDIVTWTRRHPERTDRIREMAEILLEMSNAEAEAEATGLEPSPELVRRAKEITKRHFDEAFGRRDRNAGASLGFTLLMKVAGKGVPRLARDLDVGRAVLTDLVQGRMTAPMPTRFAAALAAALEVGVDVVQDVAGFAAARTQMGRAKAAGTPIGLQRSFAEIVADDPTMTAERKAFWLGEG